MGRFLILSGLLLIVTGFLLHFKVEIPWFYQWMGKLPGDLIIKKKNATIYFPITTSLAVSLFVSLVLSLLFKSEK